MLEQFRIVRFFLRPEIDHTDVVAVIDGAVRPAAIRICTDQPAGNTD